MSCLVFTPLFSHSLCVYDFDMYFTRCHTITRSGGSHTKYRFQCARWNASTQKKLKHIFGARLTFAVTHHIQSSVLSVSCARPEYAAKWTTPFIHVYKHWVYAAADAALNHTIQLLVTISLACAACVCVCVNAVMLSGCHYKCKTRSLTLFMTICRFCHCCIQ